MVAFRLGSQSLRAWAHGREEAFLEWSTWRAGEESHALGATGEESHALGATGGEGWLHVRRMTGQPADAAPVPEAPSRGHGYCRSQIENPKALPRSCLRICFGSLNLGTKK